jgi:ketosteroid isomerase-like protein
MKRCPTCNKSFTDQNLSFCIDDGTPLVLVDTSADETTLVLPASGDADNLPGGPSGPSPEQPIPPYQPPASYLPPGQGSKRKIWPWVLAILAILIFLVVGLGITAAILIPRMFRATSGANNSNFNANIARSDNYNSNLNRANSKTEKSGENGDNTAAEDTSPPTDEEEVLADLRDLEDEWTVANINADKKKLDRILADDYVGTSAEGKTQGKAEYLKAIERDTTIQKWDFEDLKVSLKGDRATLTGVIRLQIQNQELSYRFTDKFVWRDGRWQATGSEVSPIKS